MPPGMPAEAWRASIAPLPCAQQTAAPPPAELLDCYMAASLLAKQPRLPWQRDVRRALHDALDARDASGPFVPPPPRLQALQERPEAEISAAAAAQRRAVSSALAPVRRWHLVTQNRLFADLRALWADDRPRRMLDLGCHAGAGRYKNLSDALIWLQHFNASGGEVLGVDALEDFAQDLQHRFDDVVPYAAMRGVRKRALQAALHGEDSGLPDLFYTLKPLMTCCTGQWCSHWNEPRWAARDHHCRIIRHRLGVQPAAWRPPPSSYPPALFTSLRLGNLTRTRWPPYRVRARRADTLWREELGGAPLDFVKVDVDKSWVDLGLDGLLRARAFRVMTAEVDPSWGWPGARGWGVYAMDQLAWLARRHGYATYLKVPCRARRRAYFYADSPRARRNKGWAAWYLPLAGRAAGFAPSGLTVKDFPLEQVQDLLILDEAAPELARLPRMARDACET